MSKKKKHEKSDFKAFCAELIASKPSAREIDTEQEKKYYLIVTEGERTEPIYFEFIKDLLPKNLIETIDISGEGDNTINIVRKAIEYREQRKKDTVRPNFDHSWAVFDKDDFLVEDYNGAIQLAQQSDIETAESNEAFELWYVLHFQFLDTKIDREQYKEKLTELLGFKYEKGNEKVVKYLFDNCNIRNAISFAKKLEDLHTGVTASESCPYTRVYKLVEELLEYCKYQY